MSIPRSPRGVCSMTLGTSNPCGVVDNGPAPACQVRAVGSKRDGMTVLLRKRPCPFQSGGRRQQRGAGRATAASQPRCLVPLTIAHAQAQCQTRGGGGRRAPLFAAWAGGLACDRWQQLVASSRSRRRWLAYSIAPGVDIPDCLPEQRPRADEEDDGQDEHAWHQHVPATREIVEHVDY